MTVTWGLLIMGVALLLLGGYRWQHAQSFARESVQVTGEVINHDRALNVEGRGRIHLPKGGPLSEDEALAMAGLPPGGRFNIEAIQYAPVVRYQDERGGWHEYISPLAVPSPTPAVGENVVLAYRRSAPHEASLPSARGWLIGVPFALGVALCVVALRLLLRSGGG
ncbi:DUF3592 domain-containing protein [Cobetia crustatorum]|uniref:DUF3592 domain-containing protein n=1 Tax=Cobetia crustatorum TaxID=553385 RepID=A0A558HUM3_9GAMM|nr:DUF3592 domain-containing protein [Cobetia crustatorum]TVU72814.1 hypothetical protein FQP86_03885 [Cobetia crustatorum]